MGVVGRLIVVAPVLLLNGNCVQSTLRPDHHDWWAECVNTELADPRSADLETNASGVIAYLHSGGLRPTGAIRFGVRGFFQEGA